MSTYRSLFYFLKFSSIFISKFMLYLWLILLARGVQSNKFGGRTGSQKSFIYTFSTFTYAEDTFIINLINQEKFSKCSVLILRDRFDTEDSVDRILENVSSSSNPSTKTVFSIKYRFPEDSELEDIGSRLKDFGIKLAHEENDVNLTNVVMSADALPVRFPVAVSNFRRRSHPCLVLIFMINDLRPPFMKQIFNMLTPVYIPLTKKDEDFYIFKTQPKLHQKLLMMHELPSRIKFKIAIGMDSTVFTTFKNHKKVRTTKEILYVHTVCFFCEPGGYPRMVRLAVTETNLPIADKNYFPDFVTDLNGKLLRVSLPFIRPAVEADPPWEGTFNARRGHWKYLFETYLTVKFNFTYNMFTSTGIDGNKGGGGTGLLLQNGTWIGVTGDLVYEKADLGIVVAHTPIRVHYIDYADGLFTNGYLTFVTAQPSRVFSPAALLWPFDLGMWTAIGMSTLLSIIFFFSSFKIMEVLRFGTGEKWSLSVQIQFLLSTFLDQDSPVLPNSHTMRSFVSLWFFFTMIITNIYRSKMVSLLAFPVLGKLPQTFEELVFSDYEIGFMKHGDSAYNTLAASTDPVYVKLVAEMEIFTGVGLKCMEKVVKYKYGCIGYNIAMIHVTERNLSEADTANLVYAPARTYNIWLGLATEGKSIYRINFGKWISLSRAFHLADIWDKMDMYYNVRLPKINWWKSTGQTDKMKHLEQGIDNLTLKHISGAFYVLFGLLSISSVAFIHELLSIYWSYIVVWCVKTGSFLLNLLKLLVGKWKKTEKRNSNVVIVSSPSLNSNMK